MLSKPFTPIQRARPQSRGVRAVWNICTGLTTCSPVLSHTSSCHQMRLALGILRPCQGICSVSPLSTRPVSHSRARPPALSASGDAAALMAYATC